jgi:hypothetical protein
MGGSGIVRVYTRVDEWSGFVLFRERKIETLDRGRRSKGGARMCCVLEEGQNGNWLIEPGARSI